MAALARVGSYLGVALLWLLHWLPNRTIATIGRALGRLLYRFGRGRVTDINLRLCFPDRSIAERTTLARAHFESMGRSLAELSILWFASDARILAMVSISGLAHIQQLRKDNPRQPIIYLAPHFIGLNMGGARLAYETDVSASLYSRQKNPVLDRLLLRGRLRFGNPTLISRQEGLRPVIRVIREGKPFYFLPDMDLGRRDSIFVPFFGVPTATVNVLPRLVKLTGAIVIPVVTRQLSDGYRVEIQAPWTGYPTGAEEADVNRMNQTIEALVQTMPEQYLWSHKRFKTRPIGEPSPYK